VGGLLWQLYDPAVPFFLSGILLLLASGAATRWSSEAVEG
jgi:hypothetical protein